MSRAFAAFAAVFLAFVVLTVPARAAVDGLVRGTVTLDGKPVSGAAVTIEGQGSRFTTTSDAKGDYVFSQVPFGSYRIIAQAPGAHEIQTLVTISSGQVLVVNLALSTNLKQIAQTTVTSHAGPAQNPTSVNQLDKSTIATSPVNNSLDRMLETLPGVVQFSYNEPVINGFHGVSYNIDGAPLPVATTSNFAEIIDPKLIDSMEVLTGDIPAEYGGDRIGGVVNIITNRPSDVPPGTFGMVTGGFGNQGQGIGSFDMGSRFGNSEFFLSANSGTTDRGLDAPTPIAINDASSYGDEFLRFITELSPRSTLAFDYSNSIAQFQIPINTQAGDPYDPVISAPGTLDTQREYSAFSNLNWTTVSRDGNGVFQVIPWWRSATIDYDGDLPLDVLAVEPNFTVCPPTCAPTLHLVGLDSSTFASYVGIRASDFRATKNHAWKIGVDIDRSTATADQTFACYYVGCKDSGPVAKPYYAAVATPQGQAGSQVGIYAEDKWQMSPYIVWNYGLRYDASTGYVGGNQISPRIGVSIWNGRRDVAHVYYARFYAAPLLEDTRQDCVLLSASPGACFSAHPVYDLKPESDAYFETGITHTFNPQFTLGLNIFQKSVVNVLDTSQLFNTPIFAVYNNSIGINHGAELRLVNHMLTGDQWFVTGTYSGSYAACISGATFLFPPNPVGIPCVAQLSLEDHSQTVDATAGYTHRFGGDHKLWYSTLQTNYGSGFPVFFQDANAFLTGNLPAHTTLDFSLGRDITPGRPGEDQGLGFSLQVLNVLNHQYVIKVANGFNTTQYANGRNFLFRVSQPF
jgi:outer membrane receptor protein involved in Fe transport